MGVAALPYITAAIAAYGAYSADSNAKAARAMQPPKPPPPPQEEKLPDQSQARKAGQALVTGAGQQGSTFLTGPGGVPNSSISLGYNTLLGG